MAKRNDPKDAWLLDAEVRTKIEKIEKKASIEKNVEKNEKVKKNEKLPIFYYYQLEVQ